MIIGKNIGVVETIIESLHVNNTGAATVAEKGDLCAFPLDVAVHHSDKLYKIVAADV
jgi:hypothetical protein